MRILLLTPRFYGIENKMIDLLEEAGSEVYWVENKSLPLDYHGTKAKFKLIRKIYFLLFFPRERYISNELKKIDNIKFDLLFAINGFVACPFLLRRLKKANPEIRSVLFLWDSFSKYNWKKELKQFNRVFTFDWEDSKKFNIEYRPNFYLYQNRSDSTDQRYDIYFTGKFTPERVVVIDNILAKNKDHQLKSCFLMWPAYKKSFHNKFFYTVFRKLCTNSEWIKNYIANYEAVEGITIREYFINNYINYEKLQYGFLNSNVILDPQYENQSGYSHRLIEALAAGKKILTSNRNIIKENFYDPLQIKIFDYLNPQFDYNWIKEKKSFPVPALTKGLELKLWLKHIIDATLA